TFASTRGVEPDNVANQQPPIDLCPNDPSSSSDEYSGKKQYGQQDGETIRKFQANESLSNEHQERKKSENVISTGIDQLKNASECKDLIVRIPGLYRLLDLCKDDGSNGLVDKTIISKEFIKKLCDDIVPSSFKSISEINYAELNSISVRLIGCYGNRHLISKLLLNLEIIDQEIYDLLIVSQPSIDNSNLRPGIYLLVVNSDFGLVIHWPEVGCYEENTPSQCKKNMTNLHSGSDDDKGFHEYEVKKSQEVQEDLKFCSGFKVDLSSKIKAELINTQEDGVPLHPIIVESATNQSFVTQRLIKKNSRFKDFTPIVTGDEMSQLLQSRLQGRRLYIDRESMDMKSLEILIIHGLKMVDELLVPYHSEIEAAKLQNEEKKKQKIEIMKKDSEIILNLAWKKSRDRYRPFEEFESKLAKITPSRENIIHISDKEGQIDEVTKINSKNWNKLKSRYILTSTIIFDILEMTKESAIQVFYNVFEETDQKSFIYRLSFKKFNINSVQQIIKSKNLDVNSVQDLIDFKNISDENFVRELIDSPFIREEGQSLAEVFFEEYKIWRNSLSKNVKKILKDDSLFQQLKLYFSEKFGQELQKIESREFNRICNEIEEKYQNNGTMQMKILRIAVYNLYSNDFSSCDSFLFNHKLEVIEPDQLQITIYETSLKESDTFQLRNEEHYIPNPTLLSYNIFGPFGVTFQIDPAIYDFKKISQFENRKFLIVLYNKINKQIELYFDTAQRLAKSFKAFKALNMDDNFLIAINEPMELIAIYNTNKFVLNVYSFNDGQKYLYARNPNVLLKQ
ncbi:8479_t:CDS:10, partial [Funneliformis mosseae]